MKNNQKGFGAIEALVIVLIVGLIGFGGWYILSKNTDETKQANATKQANKSDTSYDKDDQEDKTPKYDYPADKWIEYQNQDLGFTFHYPKEWGDVDVRFDGKDGFYMAHINQPSKGLSVELRGNSAEKTHDNHGEYSKGFYRKDGKYYKVAGDDGDHLVDPKMVIGAYSNGGLDTLLIKHGNMAGYETLELIVNLKDKNVLGLDLVLMGNHTGVESGPTYTAKDVEAMKQVAASFKKR